MTTPADGGSAEIPAGMLSQVISCHNATCEFLRQYWTAVLPSPPGALNPAAPAQKSAKAAKMAGYLGKTADKVAALVTTAERSGIDPSRVQVVSTARENDHSYPGARSHSCCCRQGSRQRSCTQQMMLTEAWPNGATGA
jgi:hypothetical protein